MNYYSLDDIYFFYANMASIKLDSKLTYGIYMNNDFKFVGLPSILSSLYLADGTLLNSALQLYGTSKINGTSGASYLMEMKLIDGVKLNSDGFYESDMSQSVLLLKLGPTSNKDLPESGPDTFNFGDISIYKYDNATGMPVDNDYELEQLSKVALSVEGLYKVKLRQLQLGFDYDDKLNRLIDRSVHTPNISRHKFSIPMPKEIKLHPGERTSFYIDEHILDYNKAFEPMYQNHINGMGNKTVLVKFTNICFTIFGKNANGTYNDTIVGATTVPTVMFNCHDGFSMFERTEGSKMAVSVMDDGRIDICNLGTDSFVIPQYIDASLDNTNINKYNMIYFEINWLSHNTIVRNDYGCMTSRNEYNSTVYQENYYSNTDAAYKSLICDENIWFNNITNKFMVHVDINRSINYNLENDYDDVFLNCNLRQIYIKWPSSEVYELVDTVGDYNDDNIININYAMRDAVTSIIYSGFDFEIKDQDKILNLKYGEVYKFAVKIVDQYGNIDIRHYRIIPSSIVVPPSQGARPEGPPK